MISTAIYTMLYADLDVQGLVNNRIYPQYAEQGAAMPYLVYHVVSQIPADSKDSGTGFDKYRVQIDCVDDDYTQAETLAGYVRTALDRQSGTYNDVYVDNVVYEDTNDLPGFMEDSEQTFGKAVDFMVIVTGAPVVGGGGGVGGGGDVPEEEL